MYHFDTFHIKRDIQPYFDHGNFKGSQRIERDTESFGHFPPSLLQIRFSQIIQRSRAIVPFTNTTVNFHKVFVKFDYQIMRIIPGFPII